MTEDKILLDHGSGGKISHAMFSDLILPLFDNPELRQADDGASLEIRTDSGVAKLAFSTDSYVVDPIFFPGGNIGDLAINGTVNDIAMCGAIPEFISVGLIIEEGFAIEDLKLILKAMAAAAQKAKVRIVTGDTKVVPKGKADKIFINTSGIGRIAAGVNVSGANAKPGDVLIISGTIADHGITILSSREGLRFDSDIRTDSAPLNGMVQDIFNSGANIHVLRDPTRGGLGTTLNEIAIQSGVDIEIKEKKIPVQGPVRGICELLGFDPLYIANEGKLLALVPENEAQAVLETIQKNEYGKDAAIIGRVIKKSTGRVYLRTAVSGVRPLDMLIGEQFPRIC
jgi:hydrogenase expression/formation protein HypE